MLKNMQRFWRSSSHVLTSNCREIRSCSKLMQRQRSLTFCHGSNSPLQNKSHGYLFTRVSPAWRNSNRYLCQDIHDQSVVEPNWEIQELYMVTCVDMWEDYPHGAKVIVGYIDTASALDKARQRQMPSVLAIARDLAHAESLRPLLEPLACAGFRVVMPFLIGSEPTRGVTSQDEERFDQFLGERSAFLLDFIHASNVNRFDLAIGHGLECFPLIILASDLQVFDSMAFICPLPGQVPPRCILPLRLSLKMLNWYEHVLRRPFAALWYHAFVQWKVATLKRASAAELHLFAEIAHGINYDMIPGLAPMIEYRQVPMLYVFCDGDPMIDSRQSKEFAEMFGVTARLTESYGPDGTLTGKADALTKQYLKGLQLSARTHFPHTQKHNRDIIVKELLSMYQQSSSAKKSPKNLS